MLTAEVADVVAAAPVAFLLGLAVGFIIGARYTIIKKNHRNEGSP